MLFEDAMNLIHQYAGEKILTKSIVNDVLKAVDDKSDYDYIVRYVKEQFGISIY